MNGALATGDVHSGAGVIDAGAGRATALTYRLRGLGTAGAILQLGAHPDDEDSGVLALMARGRGARVVYWSATRGCGGQNKRGAERGDALGVLRTWESLDARSIDGAEVLYGPFIDFGFSKDGQDALRRWGREELVREMVRAIRMVQPLVVIGRWSGTSADGHGHHQAVGMVTTEAISAAGDPERFPELRLPPWRPAKVYRSLGGDWQPGEDADFGSAVSEYDRLGHLCLDAGELDPVSGLTYQELGDLAMNRHRSQGMGFVPKPGRFLYYYGLENTSGLPAAGRERSFYDGVDAGLTGLARYPGGGPPELGDRLEALSRLAAEALETYRPHAPWHAAPALLDALSGARELEAGLGRDEPALAFAVHRVAVTFEETAALCLGLRLECSVDRARVTPGQKLLAHARFFQGAGPAVALERLGLEAPEGWTVEVGGEGEFSVTVSPGEQPRAPYWLRRPHGPYRYVCPDDSPELGQALDDPLVVAVAEVRIGQQLLTLRAAAVELGAFAGGSRALPVTVVPALELTPRDLQLIVPVSGDQALIGCDVMVRCIAPADAPKSVSLSAPRGWTVEPSQIETQFDAAGESRTLQFRVRVPGDVPPGAYELAYSGVKLDPVRLGAPGAPGEVDEQSCIAEVNLVRPAVVKVNFVDADFVRTLRYGYVRGMDEEVISSLGRFDIDVTTLGDDDLRYGDLHSFDAIVIGPNAYNLSGELRRRAKRLLDYVAEGGTLLVLYQGYGYDAPGLAPYPFRFHQPHDRVTDPAARVELLDPKCPILSAPNTIEQADFDGWVHDRGLYFFGEWDRRYTPVLAMHDAGEPPIQGGLLTTSYGQGTYIYAGLSFHRQIPAGVRGAIRLFANALGLAEARVRERMERLRGLELFGYMDEEQLYAAARSVSERWIDAGRIFARQGDPGRELFVVVEGTVEVVMHRPAGERLLHVAQAGESLGELALLAGTPRSASLRASTDVIVLVLRAEALDDWLQHHPDLSRRLLRMLARKILSDDAST